MMYAVFDVETTGGSPKQERIIEIAIVKFDGNKVIDSFHSLINPEKNIPPYVVKLTGINNEMVRTAPLFAAVIEDIRTFVEGCIFVAHDINSDYGFVKYEFKNENQFFRLPRICTLKLCKKLYPDLPKYNLKFLTDKFELIHNSRHRAMGDAEATALLLRKLLEKSPKELIGELLNISVSEKLKDFEISNKSIQDIPEDTGTLLFYDKENRLLMAEMSNDMNQNISDMIFYYSAETRKGKMLKKCSRVKTIVTGSSMLAELLQLEFIIKCKPVYNRKQVRSSRFTELNFLKDPRGYLNLNWSAAKNNFKGKLVFTSRQAGQKLIDQLVKRHQLCHYLCSEEINRKDDHCVHFESKYCKGACIAKENVEDYNKKVMSAVEELKLPEEAILIDEGPDLNTKTAVLISEGICKAYGFIESSFSNNSYDSIMKSFRNDFKPLISNPALNQVVRKYISKGYVERLIEV